MPSDNQITVLEATPMTVANLNRMKSVPPRLNLGATEMSKGNNGGISFNQNNEDTTIYGPFDVQLTYMEEDGELVPYVQVFDSSLQTATFAGYVYYRNTILNILPGVLAPSAGWLYLDINLRTNTYTYNIAQSVPTYPLATQRWCYALAYITVSNNIYTIRRIHVPGNIIMPTLDDGYQGYFKLSYVYENETDSQTGETTQVQKVYCSGGTFCLGGQIGSVSAQNISGTLKSSMQDVVLHYHLDVENQNDSIELIFVSSFVASSYNSTETDAYWLIGQASTTQIIQQSYGVPQLMLVGDCET